MLGNNPIAWKSGQQPLITTSTAEAEYVALSLATKKVIATARFLQGFHALSSTATWPVTVHEDNEPSIKMALTASTSSGLRQKAKPPMDSPKLSDDNNLTTSKVLSDWRNTALQRRVPREGVT